MSGAARLPEGGRTIAEFEQWLDTAKVGARFVYAWGAYPQRRLPVWSHAGDAAREGVVLLHHLRAAGGGWDYVAVRSDPPIVAPKSPSRPSVGDDDHPAQKLLRVLRRAANFSRPCPSNSELARQCGLPDAAAARRPVCWAAASTVARQP